MAAERSPPRRVCGYRQTMSRDPVPLKALISFGRRQWHQSDVAPIATASLSSFCGRSLCIATSAKLSPVAFHLRPRIACCCHGPGCGSPPRASNLSCAARLRAGLPGTSPHPSQHALNSGSIRCLISRSEAAHNASVSSTDAVRTHDLRISVTHGLRKLHRRQLQG
jgi:hypothetical protein